jgi:hypothetical protein
MVDNMDNESNHLITPPPYEKQQSKPFEEKKSRPSSEIPNFMR